MGKIKIIIDECDIINSLISEKCELDIIDYLVKKTEMNQFYLLKILLKISFRLGVKNLLKEIEYLKQIYK